MPISSLHRSCLESTKSGVQALGNLYFNVPSGLVQSDYLLARARTDETTSVDSCPMWNNHNGHSNAFSLPPVGKKK